MDDRDFEAQLSARLHRRFDGVSPSAELVGSVQQILTTKPAPVGMALLRARRREIGWAALLAAGVVAALALANGALGPLPSFGSKPTPPGPTFVPSDDRIFIVVPPTTTLPSKAETTLADAVLSKRLRALGFETFSSSIGNAIQYALPADGPNDRTVRDALSATGDVEFVPLPVEQYGTSDAVGPLVPVVGQPLPSDEPALFGWEGIESFVADRSLQDFPVLKMTLKPAAAEAFGDYTAAHVGEFFAVVVDGLVVSNPSINEEIRVGVGQVSLGPSQPGDPISAAMAVLIGGELPEAWAEPAVPELKSQAEAILEARGAIDGGANAAVQSAELDVIEDEGGWQISWQIVLLKPDGIMQVLTPAERGQ